MRAVFIALSAVLLATPASAQTADFLFGSPTGAVGFRTGWMTARADSDLFEFVTDEWTIEKNDFNAPAFGIDFDFGLTPRLSAVGGFEISGSSVNAEYRDFVDNERLPITHETSLREISLTSSVKYSLVARGREVSSRAWIPSPVMPFVGGGIGLMHHEFKQSGDFIRSSDSSVFADTLVSSGWSPTAHVFGGVDVKASKRLYITGEARYLWSHADLDAEFYQGFEGIDLSGFKVTGGLRVLF